jgi:FecR protein
MDNAPQETISNGVNGRIVFFVVLAAILGVFWYVTRPENVKAPNGDGQIKNTSIGGEIAFVEGAVEVKKAGGEWTRASANTVLAQGDSVEVVGTGKAIINLDDGSAIRLNKDSGVTLTSLAGDHYIITNDKGQVYTRVVKSNRIFEVASAGATYQSVGTAYKTVNEEKLKGVEVYESKVKILGASDKEILVEQGNKYYVLNTANKKAEKTFVKITSAEIKKDEFLTWNKAEDIKLNEAEAETAAATEKTENAGKIVLSAKQVSGGISLTWTADGVDAPNGFKVVKSTQLDPVYPGNDYYYASSADTRSYKWPLTDGKTYFFRVCQYIDGVCKAYSNNLKITAPKAVVKESPTEEQSNAVNSISVSSLGNGQVLWRVSGYSELGFKVVWSKTSGPTYPTRDGDKYNYLTDPKATTATIDVFDGEGVYYVRVCEYLGGRCGVYSNQIQVSL